MGILIDAARKKSIEKQPISHAFQIAFKDARAQDDNISTTSSSQNKFYSENTVAANSILIISSEENRTLLQQTLKAALKANKDMKIAVIVDKSDYGINKNKIIAKLSKEYAIPSKNIVPIINDS